MQDLSGEHKQFEFSGDEAKRIWNSTGQTIDIGGQQYSVANPGNGNRTLTKLSANESMASAAQAQLDFQRKAAEPLISTLGSQIPTQQALYAQKGSALQGQVEPLKARYESALNALTAGSQTAVQTAQTGASREFGARGISLDSSAYGQYLQGQVNPIASSYAGQYGQLQGNEADAILQLQNMIAENPLLAQQAIDAINEKIGGLQMGNPQEATSSALQMLNLQQQAQQNAASLALQEKIANMQYAPTKTDVKGNYVTLPEGNTLYNLLTGQATYTAPKTYAPKAGNSSLPDLGAIFG